MATPTSTPNPKRRGVPSVWNDAFFASLPDHPVRRLLKVADHFAEHMGKVGAAERRNRAEEYAEAWGVLNLFGKPVGFKEADKRIEPISQYDVEKADPHPMTARVIHVFKEARDFAESALMQESVRDATTRYRGYVPEEFHYELSEESLEQIQEHLDELRQLIIATTELSDGHKQRVLRRLERLQSELHKNMSDFDRFGGMILDVVSVAAAVGQKAQPIVKLAGQILALICGAHLAANGLPPESGKPLLPWNGGK